MHYFLKTDTYSTTGSQEVEDCLNVHLGYWLLDGGFIDEEFACSDDNVDQVD